MAMFVSKEMFSCGGWRREEKVVRVTPEHLLDMSSIKKSGNLHDQLLIFNTVKSVKISMRKNMHNYV